MVATTGVGLALALLLAPITRYVAVTQPARRESVESYYKAKTIAEYLQQFRSSGDLCSMLQNWQPGTDPGKAESEAVKEKFTLILDECFGAKRFYYALVLLVLISAPILFGAIESGLILVRNGYKTSGAEAMHVLGLRADKISIAAIAGAYTWIVGDAITRNYQGTLNVSHLYWYALRMLIAVPLGYAIAKFTTDASFGTAIAFLINLFSYDRISSISASLVNRALNMPASAADENKDILIKLPGIDTRTAEIMAAEGITTIAGLAAADPILVAARTGLPFDLVVRRIDAALLWQYAGTDLLVMQHFGWAGASDVIDYQMAPVPALLTDMALLTAGKNVASLENIVRQVNANDYAQFIRRLIRS
ncbi:MAG: hypothetical protein OJJ21_05890 [Ferrovibrio sp.]|uniref:hypothetical protein n=1 Tax=Ferrovibrio sp. TaxID=1917215 RepID=UPI00260CE0FF|nr:hypothetical protein [Ferrovibrio sp.]MCW0233112.1 hypothetical protein [Ferrovibrio sp.]